MLPHPHDIEYFLEIGQTQNLSRAAERLGISQPTLSLSVQRLEQMLGVQLLVRSKVGVQITKAGQRFMTHAKVLVEHWGHLQSEAVRDEQEVTGCFTLGCHPSVALYSLPRFLPRLVSENPKLELNLIHDLSRVITEKVISYKIEFGIVVNPVEHPDLVVTPLCEDEVTLWTIEKNPNEDVLICDPSLLQTQSLLSTIKKAGFRFNRNLCSSNLEVITSLVSAGVGVGILPHRVATNNPNLGLKRCSKKIPIFHDRISLIYRADFPKTKTTRVIINTIRQASIFSTKNKGSQP